MGTIFSYYMKRSEYETLSETQKDAVLLHAMVIEDRNCENLENSLGVTLLSAEDFKEMTKDRKMTKKLNVPPSTRQLPQHSAMIIPALLLPMIMRKVVWHFYPFLTAAVLLLMRTEKKYLFS